MVRSSLFRLFLLACLTTSISILFLQLVKYKSNDSDRNNEYSHSTNSSGVSPSSTVYEHGDVDDLFRKHQTTRPSCMMQAKRTVVDVNCAAILEGDEKEIEIAASIEKRSFFLAQSELSSLLSDCSQFRKNLGYDNFSECLISQEELDFPIAYSIIVHKDAPQVERLLRSIYRPQNIYCIHADKKSDSVMLQTLTNIASCFNNVFLASTQENIIYAHYSRLQAEFNCMKDFLRTNSSWKYVINLTGQMFPLKTNREIVKILKTLRGTNDIEAFSYSTTRRISYRFKKRYAVVNGELIVTDEPKDPPPLNITLIKGSVFGSFSRDFVNFILTNKRVKIFLEWLKDTYSPDELFWSTVNSCFINPMFNTPGGYEGAPERRPWLTTYASWEGQDKCRGKFVRSICIFGIADLQQLVTRLEMFANKFYSNYQPLTLECLQEWLHNKTLNPPPFPVFIYKEKHYYLHPNLE